mmetsp:Transcript_14788/g.37330  ORF Transcript_14788/g.37330 Transcript_14788/m.37330 type:complete len:250 (-) Transcript_14788:388-1137(-)
MLARDDSRLWSDRLLSQPPGARRPCRLRLRICRRLTCRRCSRLGRGTRGLGLCSRQRGSLLGRHQPSGTRHPRRLLVLGVGHRRADGQGGRRLGLCNCSQRAVGRHGPRRVHWPRRDHRPRRVLPPRRRWSRCLLLGLCHLGKSETRPSDTRRLVRLLYHRDLRREHLGENFVDRQTDTGEAGAGAAGARGACHILLLGLARLGESESRPSDTRRLVRLLHRGNPRRERLSENVVECEADAADAGAAGA